jgi:hypothetical protein
MALTLFLIGNFKIMTIRAYEREGGGGGGEG